MKTRRLRTQLTLAMLIFFVCAFGFIYGGARMLDAWLNSRYLESLPPAALRAGLDLEALRLPDPADLRALKEAAEAGQARAQLYSDLGLAVLTALAGFVSLGLAMALGQRLARPMERVAQAARRVAQGDLNARAEPEHRSSLELRQLVDDFNRMADSLAATQRELKESTAAIAHELRTPLTILRGRLQGIHDGLFASGPAEITALIQQVESLSRVVEDLRVVSLAAANSLALERRSVELATEVESLLPVIEPDLHALGMRLELDLRPARVHADPQRLRQVLICLLDNARRYASEGGVVRIETCSAGSAGVLRVLDRGAGFPPGGAERAFERFWRSEASRSRQTGGSGLGLSVVRAIADAHDGQARAANRPGGGAVLEIQLPASP
jgi:two-component system sensor histidine kinase BaeS/two-component system sensor histidine kinase AdeS